METTKKEVEYNIEAQSFFVLSFAINEPTESMQSIPLPIKFKYKVEQNFMVAGDQHAIFIDHVIKAYPLLDGEDGEYEVLNMKTRCVFAIHYEDKSLKEIRIKSSQFPGLITYSLGVVRGLLFEKAAHTFLDINGALMPPFNTDDLVPSKDDLVIPLGETAQPK